MTDLGAYRHVVDRDRVRLERCDACGRHRVEPMPSCPWCGAEAFSDVDAAGTGRVYSWVTVHRALDDAHAHDVPYTVATIELAEGCRVFARLDASPERIAADLAVRARYVDHDGWTELRFAPSASTPPDPEPAS
jgi:uncharacterized OB-fold protein